MRSVVNSGRHLHHAAACCRHFCANTAGAKYPSFECPVKDGQRVWYKIGRQQLHVNLQEKYHKAGFCHFAIAIGMDDYHEYAKNVAATGYKLSCESKKFEDGIYRFFLDDPFSNTVEIHQAYRNE